MRIVSIVLLCTACAFTSCSGSHNNATNSETLVATQPPKSKLDSAGTQTLLAMLKNYYQLKDALVATNASKADAAANKLGKTSAEMKMALQTNNELAELLPYLDTIQLKIKDITGMMDEGCEHKRIHFEAISNSMYNILEKAALRNAGVYQQYCPMALNDKGAYWLSNEKDIKNPYFGDKMLECGEVTDTIN